MESPWMRRYANSWPPEPTERCCGWLLGKPSVSGSGTEPAGYGGRQEQRYGPGLADRSGGVAGSDAPRVPAEEDPADPVLAHGLAAKGQIRPVGSAAHERYRGVTAAQLICEGLPYRESRSTPWEKARWGWIWGRRRWPWSRTRQARLDHFCAELDPQAAADAAGAAAPGPAAARQ